LGSLRFKQIDARQMTIKTAHAKTCRWLLKSKQYLNWLDKTKLGEHHGFLWIKGNAGTGKSTLMKFALVNARKTMKDHTVLSFFFNARGEEIEKSPERLQFARPLNIKLQRRSVECRVTENASRASHTELGRFVCCMLDRRT
jgi:hypothetical protein